MLCKYDFHALKVLLNVLSDAALLKIVRGGFATLMLYSQRPAVLSLRALCGIVPLNVGSFSGSEVSSVPLQKLPS
jgi:hypothetical protein